MNIKGTGRALVAAVAVMAAGWAQADRVVLKSGSILIGEAGLIQDGKLVFTGADFGEVKIDLANVQSIDSAKPHVVQYMDNTTASKDLDVKDGELWDGAAKLDMGKVKAIDPNIESWHGSVNFGFNAQRGNTYENAASVLANLNRRWEKDRLNLDFGYFYSKDGTSSSDAKKNTDRWEFEAKHDHFWSEKLYSLENFRFDRDEIAALDYRYRLGLGLGYQWLDGRNFESTGKWSFNQELGGNYIIEKYKSEDEDGYAALRYAHHLTYVPKWNTGMEFFHNAEILPQADDMEKFISRADLGFTTKLIMNFDLIVKMEWDFDSKPADARKKSDLRYIVGLGYKW